MSSRPRLYLIDGSSQMYRAYHAIRGLTGPDGRSTNAVYGFVTMLRKLLVDQQPAYIGAAFDLRGPTFRSELAADYKANRSPMPPDLIEQVPFVHEACEALGVPIVVQERYEADDVIATLAKRAIDRHYDVALVTGDKDFFQLVGDHLSVFNPRDEGTWFDADGVLARFGVRPDQVVDMLSLMGDSIDNVQGVPGIGEKGAKDLIARYGSLDVLLAETESVTQKKYREALLQHAESARHSRELVRLRTDVPVALDLDQLRYAGADRARCFALFSRLGFRSLVQEFAPTAESSGADYRVATGRSDLESLTSEILEQRQAAIHVVTDASPDGGLTVVGMAVSPRSGRASWIPLSPAASGGGGREPAAANGSGQGDLLGHLEPVPGAASTNDEGPDVRGWQAQAVRHHLAPVLNTAGVRLVTHDAKTTALSLAHVGWPLDTWTDDLLLASYVLDATRSTHSIESLGLDELGYRASTEEELRGKGAKAVPLQTVNREALTAFACERADLIQQLAPRLTGALEREQLVDIYRKLELPLVPVLAALEAAGIAIDTRVLADLAVRVQTELDARCGRIYELAGLEFNINSPKQLSEVLFERLQLPTSRKTGKTRATSTAVEVLEELAAIHELPREILEWRALMKLKGTYIDALPVLVRPDTGRVHTTFNQAVAATGRLSSSDPNLQNIPIRTELGREIRKAFVAPPQHRLISADYSQIELRVLAHLSRDSGLIDAFTRGEDIHDRTARNVFGSESTLDRYELRRRAKIINYALLYGKTAFTLAKDIGVPQTTAQAFIDAYFSGFPGVRQFIDETLADARATGRVTTLAGRRRLVPEITSRNGQVRAAAERIAVNMPIQGTAADILKQAMLDIHTALESPAYRGTARMILTVHDELVFEARSECAEEIAELVRRHMEGAADLVVPLTVDVGIGDNWMEAKR
ncbi:MAG: DNA polymerase I [Vicinamibacterales bacterium]